MKTAYILTTYPSLSETFIQREITHLTKLGVDITVFAAGSKAARFLPGQYTEIYYKPSFFSFSAVWAVIGSVVKHPFRLAKTAALIIRLLFICPKEAGIIFFNFPSICFFAAKIEKLSIQHIHAGFLSRPACIALAVSGLTKLPFSISAHARDIFVEAGAAGLKAKKASFITCCTKQGLKYLKNQIDSKYHGKLILNYHGIELDRPNDTIKETNEKSDFIIAVGRLVEKKGFCLLIEVFAEIAKKYPDISLVIAGEGPQRIQLENKIKKLALSEKICMAGWLDHGKTQDMIRQAKILAVPSIIDGDGDRDGIPNVILEAFSVGTPVIASDLAGISEAVIDESTGLLVKPGNKPELIESIERLLTDKYLAALLAGSAKKKLTDNFNIENNCAKLANIFRNYGTFKNRQIKIAHIVEGFVGGMSTYLCNVLVLLKDAGFDVALIYSPDRCDKGLPEKLAHLKNHGIKIYTVPMTRVINPISDLYCLFVMIRIFARERFDIVHTHCSKAGAVGRVGANLAGIKKIYHSSHCFAFLRCGNFITKKIYLLAERLLAPLTTKFIAVSNCDAESAKQWKIFGEDKCDIVNNGLLADKHPYDQKQPETISRIRRSFNLPAEPFVIVTACRLVEYKGLFTFIDAARLSKTNAIFVIAGDGPLKARLEKYITKNNLADKVKLLGHVCDMDRLYRICDLVVLCSTMEAQPFALLEAMRAKCAIIASDVRGNRELLEGQRGILVEPKSEKFAAAIDRLLSDSHQRYDLAQNASNYFHSRHKLEDQVQKLIDIYQKPARYKEKDF